MCYLQIFIIIYLFIIRRRWCQASTSKQTIQKLENGKDIEQDSSSAVVLNQSKKNGSYGRIYCPWNVKRSFYFLYVINNPPPPLLPSYIMITRTWLINTGSMLLLRNEAGIQEISGRNPKALKTVLFQPVDFLNKEMFLGGN